MLSPSGTRISCWLWGNMIPIMSTRFTDRPEWKTQAEKEKKSLDAIGAEAAELSATLNQDRPSPQSSPKGRGGREALASQTSNAEESGDEMLKLRREYLQKQITALAARVRMLKGEKLKFDDESRALYDAVAPSFSWIRISIKSSRDSSQRIRVKVRYGSGTRSGASRL